MSQSKNSPALVVGCDIGNAYAYASVARTRTADPLPLMPAEMAKVGMSTEVRISKKGEINVYPPDRSPYARSGGTVGTVKRMLRLDTLPGLQTDRPVSPWEVYSAIVRDLMTCACVESARLGETPSYDVVFTYPAVLHSPEHLELLNRMEESISSVEVNGHRLRVAGRLPEPAAAAIQYLNFIQNVAPEGVRFTGDELNVLVYDLGHGTFDLALVTARSNVTYDLRMQDGDETVGGVDFDSAVYDELCARFYRLYQFRPAGRQQSLLMDKARKVKLELCTPGVEETNVSFDVHLDGEDRTLETTLTRERFEEISAPLLLKTLEKTQAMLERADREGIRVDRIILTGGASQMPMVRSALQELVGERFTIEEPYQPSRAVSFGAALYGAYQPQGKILRQKTEQAYGLMLRTSMDDIYLHLHTMIPAGADLPARSQPLAMHAPASGFFNFQVAYSADGVNPAERKRHLQLDGLPAEGRVEVTMEVTEDLNIAIECKAPDGSVHRVGTGNNR